ncbi:MAG: hypothetical protein NZ951_00035 [Dehalococcoidia bacterium]|nr:hypothetical protein [Dehalococcoidia bacterium]MDW8119037.1 hypothetical protein [Chloroflexota bacterium]
MPKYREPPLVVDESLAAPQIVTVLQAMAFDARAVQPSEPDSAVIQWMASFGGVWITSDEEARKAHAEALQRARINVIFVHQPKGGLSRRAQIRLIVCTIERVV